MDSTSILSSFLFYFLPGLCIYLLTSRLRKKKSVRVPPGPFQWPVLGNLHQMGKNPHQSFAELAKTYGPIMSVRLGSKNAVVISSSAMAKEVLQTHDLVCSSRDVPNAGRGYDHHEYSITWLPTSSSRWRLLRKICKEKIFSNQRLDASQGLRQEKLKELRDYLQSCSGKTVDIGEAVFTASMNLVTRTLMSVEFVSYDPNLCQELKDIWWGVMRYAGTPSLSDYFPVLQRFDSMREAKFYVEKLVGIVDGIVRERLQAIEEASKNGTSLPKKNDLLEALLELISSKNDQSEFTLLELQHFLLDLMLSGNPTTATVEWAMAELLRSPEKLAKAKAELKQVVGNRVVQESDIPNLPYLQAVVKENYRLHPAAPFLIPHKATDDVQINGYTVKKDTQILVNSWAAGRDESIWPQAETFMPERFLNSGIDVLGRHFELIPFGSGRRMCPAYPLAYRMVHLMVANLIHNIHWKLEDDFRAEDMDMQEKFGLTVQKLLPLRAVPVME